MAQAENDLAFAHSALAGGFYAQCCFICQQAGEEALGAVGEGVPFEVAGGVLP